MASKNVLAEIKEDLDSFVGKKIRLRANRGRKRILERTGVLEKTYPHIFVIKIEEQKNPVQRISFSYSDVLTESVELTVSRDGREYRIGSLANRS